MQLPNRENALIEHSKLVDYLLSETHPVGQSKAKYLYSVGFDKLKVDVLKDGLLRIAQSEDVRETIDSLHGMKYVIDGTLETPVGGRVTFRTIWIIDRGYDRPRFVTAYPL